MPTFYCGKCGNTFATAEEFKTHGCFPQPKPKPVKE